MPSYKYNPLNTEGSYPTSIDFLDTEIKKGNKIVATDLVDLYDTYPETITPDQGDALVYDISTGIWNPGQGTGSSCNAFLGYDAPVDGYQPNSVFIDADTTTPGEGTYNNPFVSMNDCLIFLHTCKNIPDNITLTINLLSNITIIENIYVNHPQGYNININGNGFVVTNKQHISINNEMVTSYIFDVDTVSCGLYHTLAIRSDGTLWGTGYNYTGNLGLGDNTNRVVFTQVETDNNWKIIIGGDNHTLAIKTDGTLWGTGYNHYGNLGLGDLTDRDVFTQVGIDTDWKTVSGGGNHTLAIRSDGTLWGTGYNYYGQLGLGDNTNRDIFTQVGVDTDWVEIYCGRYYALAIKSDGTLWGTGYNSISQLGLGDNTDRNVFTQVGTDTDWVEVSCGMDHTLAIRSDGTLWGTGGNYYGQLGLGDNTNRDIFTQVGTDTDWVGVACGMYHTSVIKSTGTLWSTGNNVYGQLGLGDNTNRDTFTQSGNNSNWVNVACGQSNTLVSNTNEELFGTGNNNHYQTALFEYTSSTTLIKTYAFQNMSFLPDTSPLFVISGNNNINKIYNIKLNLELSFSDDVYSNITIYHMLVTNNSIVNMSDIIIYSSAIDRVMYGSIIVSNQSVLQFDNCNTDNILVDNSTVTIDDITADISLSIYNDSTLVLNNYTNILPDVDMYESTYIIDGIIQ